MQHTMQSGSFTALFQQGYKHIIVCLKGTSTNLLKNIFQVLLQYWNKKIIPNGQWMFAVQQINLNK